MRFSYLEHVAHEILPTIEIIWEITRAFNADNEQPISEFYQLIRALAERHQNLDGLDKLQAIKHDFYYQLGFSDAPEITVGAHRVLLDDVVSYRTGLPISLALLLQEAAAYAGLQLKLVDFPGYPLLRFDYEQASYFIDPVQGEWLEGHQLQERFEDVTEDCLTFSWEMFEAVDQKTVLRSYLTELKHAMIHDIEYSKALTVVHMLLAISPNDPYEIRDRGYVLEELDCQHAAVDDYQYFVEQCPDDPSAQLLRLQIEAWANPQHVLH